MELTYSDLMAIRKAAENVASGMDVPTEDGRMATLYREYVAEEFEEKLRATAESFEPDEDFEYFKGGIRDSDGAHEAEARAGY